jgi:hypothetical protein
VGDTCALLPLGSIAGVIDLRGRKPCRDHESAVLDEGVRPHDLAAATCALAVWEERAYETVYRNMMTEPGSARVQVGCCIDTD